MATSRYINYKLRPAKHIVRKMLIEILRRLSHYHLIEKYKYIGFGAWYFTDFYHFHKYLGIHDMISIERDNGTKERYEFNKPFGCIKIIFEESNSVLPGLEWDNKSILWLDYDKKISDKVIYDVEQFCRHAISGSLILISLNVDVKNGNNVKQYLDKNLDKESRPNWENEEYYEKGTFNVLCHQIITNKIIKQLRLKTPLGKKLNYKQLCNFIYEDGAKMMTFGGIIYSDEESKIIEGCEFEKLDFVKTDHTELKNEVLPSISHYKIKVPNLTHKEIKHINNQLPIDEVKEINQHKIPISDLENYIKIYRYYPAFTDVNI